jgi:hypothetical protein
MFKVITSKTKVVTRSEMVSTLNLDWDFNNYDDAFKFYMDFVAEHSAHVSTITATRINHDIQLVQITEEGTKLHYRLHLSN